MTVSLGNQGGLRGASRFPYLRLEAQRRTRGQGPAAKHAFAGSVTEIGGRLPQEIHERNSVSSPDPESVGSLVGVGSIGLTVEIVRPRCKARERKTRERDAAAEGLRADISTHREKSV